jgi:hypothetical protein
VNFEILPADLTERTGYLHVNLRVLQEMLRLPGTVTITGARIDDAGRLLLDVRGLLPASGEVVAQYDAIHTTIPVFRGFEPAP